MRYRKLAIACVGTGLVLGLGACNTDELVRINQDPNNPTSAPPRAVFTYATRVAMQRWFGSNPTNMRGPVLTAQHLAQVQYPDEDAYARLDATVTDGSFIFTYASELKNFQSVIDALHRQFVAKLVERRRMSPETATRLADGRIFTAEQAVARVEALAGYPAQGPAELFVFAGQPKFTSMPGAPSSAARRADSAIGSGSPPSSCTNTGTPALVVPPRATSGQCRAITFVVTASRAGRSGRPGFRS